MQDLVNYPCNLCGSRSEILLEKKKGIVTNITFRLVQCKNCGLIYFNPRLSENDLIKLYSKEYYRGEGWDMTPIFRTSFEAILC